MEYFLFGNSLFMQFSSQDFKTLAISSFSTSSFFFVGFTEIIGSVSGEIVANTSMALSRALSTHDDHWLLANITLNGDYSFVRRTLLVEEKED